MGSISNESVYLIVFALSFFAGLSGLAAHLIRCLNDSVPITWQKCLIEWLAATLGGIATIALCLQFKLGLWLSIVIVFLMGWFGVSNAADLMLKIVKDKLNIGDKYDR